MKSVHHHLNVALSLSLSLEHFLCILSLSTSQYIYMYIYIYIYIYMYIYIYISLNGVEKVDVVCWLSVSRVYDHHTKWKRVWCNGFRRNKWTQRFEFKSWTRLFAFHIALIPLGKVWIQLFSLQLWVNSRTDWVLQPWCGN